MNFLAPLFLLGALAIAGPVIFHLIRRTTRDRQRFGSLMFLEPTPPRLTKRSRIDNWLLLLLRAAALALLALAFARPFFRAMTPPGDGGANGGRTMVLVDASASLRRAGMWDAAKGRAMEAVERALANGSEAGVATFDRSVNNLLKFEDWHNASPDARVALARERLNTASPSWSGTNAAAALITAADLLAESAGGTTGKQEIVLVTDAQEGSRLESLQGYEWPKNVSVRLEIIAPKASGNAGLQLAGEASNVSPDAAAGVRLRVTNSPDAVVETLQVGWMSGSGFEGKAQDVYVPPGQSRIVTLPWLEGGSKAGRVLLRGDADDFDNTITVTPPASVTVPVIHSGLGMESPTPLFFLQKALPAGRALTASVWQHPSSDVPPPAILKTAPLWFVTAPLDAPVASAAAAYVEGGGTALIMLASTDMAGTLQSLTGSPAVSLAEVKPSSHALLGNIDFAHPLFSAFADPRFSDFTKIRFWNYRRLDPAAFKDARVIARFDSRDPAVVEVPRGKGRVFVLTAGWHTASSQLALSSKFPSLLASLLMLTGAGAAVPAQVVAGEPVPAAAFVPASVANVKITPPDGKTVALARGETFAGFTEPGLYKVAWDGGQIELAANLDPFESRTAPLTGEEFEKFGTPVVNENRPEVKPSEASEALAAAAESEGRQKIWRWLLATIFAVLFIETLLGMRAARQYTAIEGGSAV